MVLGLNIGLFGRKISWSFARISRSANPPPSNDRHQREESNLHNTTIYPPSAIMATSRDTPNPLRPYYIPPSIGLPPDTTANNTAPPSHSPPSKPSFGTHARDILSDLDYGDYLSDSSPSLAEMAKKLVDQAIWNYTTVLLAQPLEVAKTVLQVYQAPGQTSPSVVPKIGRAHV